MVHVKKTEKLRKTIQWQICELLQKTWRRGLLTCGVEASMGPQRCFVSFCFVLLGSDFVVVQSLNRVWPCDPLDCSPPDPSVRGLSRWEHWSGHHSAVRCSETALKVKGAFGARALSASGAPPPAPVGSASPHCSIAHRSVRHSRWAFLQQPQLNSLDQGSADFCDGASLCKETLAHLLSLTEPTPNWIPPAPRAALCSLYSSPPRLQGWIQQEAETC